MLEIIDKLLLLLCSTIIYILTSNEPSAVIPVLLTVFLCCINLLFSKKNVHLGVYITFLIICIIYPGFFLFLPVMIYDLLLSQYKLAIIICLLPFIENSNYYPFVTILLMTLFCILSYFLKYKTLQIQLLTKEYQALRDTSTSLTILQEEKNRSLLENQDYEINLATLNERNRISKEIHDHIGHLLSRSLLQIGALLTITREDSTREGLTALKDSISSGMDSIRASIHNMHDDSVDLYTSIDCLIKEFTFCPISFDYDIKKSPLLKTKYCFLATVKESLSNIVKHSNATLVTITLKEQPAIYQLIISDNGQIPNRTKAMIRNFQKSEEYDAGMGLQNIADRVKGFHGNLSITTDEGFKIFITIPKEN